METMNIAKFTGYYTVGEYILMRTDVDNDFIYFNVERSNRKFNYAKTYFGGYWKPRTTWNK